MDLAKIVVAVCCLWEGGVVMLGEPIQTKHAER